MYVDVHYSCYLCYFFCHPVCRKTKVDVPVVPVESSVWPTVLCRIVYYLIHDLLFLPISTIESGVSQRVVTHSPIRTWLVHA